jgi:hypothetical protein
MPQPFFPLTGVTQEFACLLPPPPTVSLQAKVLKANCYKNKGTISANYRQENAENYLLMAEISFRAT